MLFRSLPIFAVVMFIVYYVSVTTVGTWATDWANDGVFGDGWHLFGIEDIYTEGITKITPEDMEYAAKLGRTIKLLLLLLF